ncbi:hypothetical protein, partial [Microcoleus sp. PH2017_21_RUC_O_A]|uniref:hypothetical protein n=1 Tax=Microcoleus sp. PH2017_21_RUC_O_A TaxID=2798832 RepID=UPI0025F393E8
KPQMIAEQLFEVLRILNSFEIKSDRISAECGLQHQRPSLRCSRKTHPTKRRPSPTSKEQLQPSSARQSKAVW